MVVNAEDPLKQSEFSQFQEMDIKKEEDSLPMVSDNRTPGRRKVIHDARNDDSCHGDSGLLNMLAEVASATLHNDTMARRTRGRPRKQSVENTMINKSVAEFEATDANKLNLAQLQLLTEKQLVDLFAVMDSDEIRRTFSYSCRLLQRCQYTANSFGSEMKARQVYFIFIAIQLSHNLILFLMNVFFCHRKCRNICRNMFAI